MTLETFLSGIERLDKAATKGPVKIGIVDRTLDPVEWFREHLSYGQGDIWCCHLPEHPKAIGPDDKPDHAILSAITGNGPDSEANAEFFAHARLALPAAARLLRIYQQSAASRMTLLDYELLQNAIAAELAAMGGKDDK